MGNTWIAWLLALPVGGAAIATILLQVAGRSSSPSRTRLETIALSCAVAGIVLSMLVSLAAQGRVVVFGVGFSIAPLTRTILFVTNAALLCSLFVGWRNRASSDKVSTAWSTPTTSTLLAGAMLGEDGIISILCLLGSAVAVVASACVVRRTSLMDATQSEIVTASEDDNQSIQAKRITGGLKHLAISVVGTGLLVVGVLLLSRYGLNLENKALLQLGIGLLSIGLLVRAGAMPFASAPGDLVDAAPGPVTTLFSAVTPAVLLVGLVLLLPVERTLLAGNSTAWVGAVAVLLAGVRALGVRLPNSQDFTPGGEAQLVSGELVSATIAVQVGWALTGLLLGSHSGAAGSILLAVNLALTAPLLIVSTMGARDSRVGIFRLGLAISVASLLGLPPLGGFVGTLLVAQAVTTLGGFWMVLMLFGSMLVAAKWLALTRVMPVVGGRWSVVSGQGSLQGRWSVMRRYLQTDLLLVALLSLTQFALFALSAPVGDLVTTLASPWLGP